MTARDRIAAVRAALATVDDPEYPGISVIDMGMVGECSVEDGHARVELVPTFTGCPALDFIQADVSAAVALVDGIDQVTVELDRSTVWSTSRLSDRAREVMAHDFVLGVADPSVPTACPRCGQRTLVETSMFGPTRCRSISRCRSCGETVEVVRA